MKKFLWLLLLLLIPACAQAATYYVDPTTGGDLTQCSGLKDAPSPDSTGNKGCRLSHIFYVISPNGNNPTKLLPSDTVIIDGTHKIGYGSPNTKDTGKCSPSWPWDCQMRPIPSGSLVNPTKIIGRNNAKLVGVQRVEQIIDLRGSNNIEISNIEITDGLGCLPMGPNSCNSSSFPYGDWAPVGIKAQDSTNVTLHNVNIHGLGKGIVAGRLKDWTLDGVKIIGNSFVGWDGDIGKNVSANSGTLKFINTQIQYSGCGETLENKPYNCYSQDQGGYGDGLGTETTGGDWIFDNVDFSHNVSDGLDLLYHNGSGAITIKNSRFEENAGNQLKTHAPTTIENTTINGNCAYFKDNPITWKSSTFNNCRAEGNALASFFRAGTKVDLKNVTFKNVIGTAAIISGGDGCDSNSAFTADANTPFDLKNRFFDPGTKAVKYYASGGDGNGSGSCGSLKLVQGNGGGFPCFPTWCDAPLKPCNEISNGLDSCGKACSKPSTAWPACTPVIQPTEYLINLDEAIKALEDTSKKVIIKSKDKRYKVIGE